MGVEGGLSLDLHNLAIVSLAGDDDDSLLLTRWFFVRLVRFGGPYDSSY